MIDPSNSQEGLNPVAITNDEQYMNSAQYNPKIEVLEKYESDNNIGKSEDPSSNNANGNRGSHEDMKNDPFPQYWDLLTDDDKNGYRNLKMAFNAGSIKRNRGHRIETFDGILDAIRRYAEQGNENDWKRFLVCGVCWMDQAIAINTRQLRLLISKCKSSINGSLQKLGFSTNTSHSESWKILFSRIPLLKDNFTEIRQWTIRYRIPSAANGAILNSITHQQTQQQNQPQQLQRQGNHKNNHNQDSQIIEFQARQQIRMMHHQQQQLQIINKFNDSKGFKNNNSSNQQQQQPQQMFPYQFQILAQQSQQKPPFYPIQMTNQITLQQKQLQQNYQHPIQSQDSHFIQNSDSGTLSSQFPSGQHLPPLQRCPLKFRVKMMEMERKSDKNKDST